MDKIIPEIKSEYLTALLFNNLMPEKIKHFNHLIVESILRSSITCHYFMSWVAGVLAAAKLF